MNDRNPSQASAHDAISEDVLAASAVQGKSRTYHNRRLVGKKK
jgi:hypothetical protein